MLYFKMAMKFFILRYKKQKPKRNVSEDIIKPQPPIFMTGILELFAVE